MWQGREESTRKPSAAEQWETIDIRIYISRKSRHIRNTTWHNYRRNRNKQIHMNI